MFKTIGACRPHEVTISFGATQLVTTHIFHRGTIGEPLEDIEWLKLDFTM